MIYLLIGGAQSVGKTQTIIRTADYLLNNGFKLKEGIYPNAKKDILILIEGLDKAKNKIRIIINSGTDTIYLIQKLKNFYDDNLPIDFIISSVRDDGAFPSREFYKIMNISQPTDTVIEIPLAKITRRGVHTNPAISWYEDTIDKLIKHVLSNNPFNVI